MTAARQDRPEGPTAASVDPGRPDGPSRARRRTGAAAVVAAGLLVAPGAHAATTTTGPAPAPRATTTSTDPAATPDAVDPAALPPASTTADPAVPPATPTTTNPAPPADDADGVREDDSLGDDSGGAGRAEAAKAQRARERREARQALARKHAAAARRRAAARKKAAKEAREKAKAEREADRETAEDPTDDADADAAGGTAGDAADPSLLGGDAELLRAPAAIPDLFIARFRIPPFLLPIYQAAGVEYGIRWEVLAAINEIETDYGRNLNVSSAGAQGWMQFMPATWKTYGTDADGDGQADPMDPVDAIFSAARYLKAAGAEDSIRKAIFAYNHADWYVDSVMLRARLISGLPEPLVSSLTGLAQGTLPVQGAVADPDAPGASPVPDGTPAPDADAPLWSGRPGDDRAAQITARPGTEVVAVQDGTVIGTGHNEAMGHWIRLRDVFGNRYTYAHLGSVADTYAAPESTEEEEAAAAAAQRDEQRDPAPDAPATAGTQPALDAIAKLQSGTASSKPVTPAPGSPLLADSTKPGGPNGATTPAAHEQDETRVPKGYGVPVPPAGPGDPAAAAAPAGGSVDAAAPAAPSSATPAAATPATPVTGATAAAPTAGATTPGTPSSGGPSAPATGTAAPALGALPVPGLPSPASPVAMSSSILAPVALPTPEAVLAAVRTGTPSTATILAREPLSTLPAARPAKAAWAGVPTTTTAAPAATATAPVQALAASVAPTATPSASSTTSKDDSAKDATDDDRSSGSSDRAPRIVLKDLRTGARVNGGTVLGTIGRAPKKGESADGRRADMAFGVRPAGKGAPRVDPRPLLDGWRLLSATAERESAERSTGAKKSALFGIRAGSATAGQVLLLGKESLQARVLADDRIEIPAVGRAQIRAGLIDRRVLATLAYLSANGHDLRISSLRRPGSITTSGNLSEHDSGNAVDIAAVDGQIISPKTQGAGSITDRAVRLLLRLQGTMTPHQIITLMGPDDFGGASNVLAMGDHDDHIHVGFSVAGGDGAAAGGQLASALKPGQWDDLVERLGKIENPQVATKASRFALKVRR